MERAMGIEPTTFSLGTEFGPSEHDIERTHRLADSRPALAF
jgi:hypothetical protein